MKKLLVWLAMAVPLAAQVPAGAQTAVPDPPPDWLVPTADLNRDLPSWLRLDGRYRNRFERSGGIKFGTTGDSYDLGQLRLWISIAPLRWLKLVAESQDSRVAGNQVVAPTPPLQNTWDIRQAYVQLGGSTSGWFDFVAGRQMVAFGDERLIGPSDWLNMGRTFDILRLDLHHPGYTVSLFSSSVIIARDGVINHHLQGNNLHGIYSSFSRLVPKAVFEPYVLWRVAPGNVKLNENAGRGALSEVTAGARIAGKLPASFDYNVEMAGQLGSLGPYSIRSWAGHWNAGKTLPNVAAAPRLFLEANYASGTGDPTGHTWSTFDQLYPSNHNKLGFADQIGWRNIEQVRAGAEQNVSRKWKFTETYENFWLASARDALYSTGGAPVAQSRTGAAGRHVGQELDAWCQWLWRSTVELGFGYAHVFTGSFLNQTTLGKDYNYPFVYMTYRFAGAAER